MAGSRPTGNTGASLHPNGTVWHAESPLCTRSDDLEEPTMTDPYIGEIRNFGFNFTPRGWASCQGQLLPISSNTALFSLLGTMYGGDGRVTFALPDLQGRVSLSAGQGSGLSPRVQG